MSRPHPRLRLRTPRKQVACAGEPWLLVVGLACGLWIAAAPTARCAPPDEEALLQELKTIAELRIEGRRQVGLRELRSVMKTRGPSWWPLSDRPVLRLDFLRSDVEAIRSLYRHHGLLDAQVDYEIRDARQENEVVVGFRIDEGPRTRIRDIAIRGNDNYPSSDLRKRLWAKPNRPFDPAFLKLDTLLISALYQDRGRRPHVQAGATRESLWVTIQYQIEEGPEYRNGQSYISGQRDVPERLIRRDLLMHPGTTYRSQRVLRSLERLYDTGLFSQVQITPIPDSTHTVVEFDLRVREREPRWIDAGIGSGTDERFRLTAEWGRRNMFRRGIEGAISSRLSFHGNGEFQRWFAGGYVVEPWLFNTRTRGRVSLYYERNNDLAEPAWVVRQEFEGVDFELRREINRFTRVSLTQKNVFGQQGIEILDPALAGSARIDSLARVVVRRYTTHRLILSGERDFRDNPFDATRGSAQWISAETAGGPLQGTRSFHKITTTSAWYTPVRGSVIATRIRAGIIRPAGPGPDFSPEVDVDPEVARVPLEDRFRVGGVNSIRGYDENGVLPSGGLIVLQGNAEIRVPTGIRIPFLGPLGVEFYADAGNVWARPGYIQVDQFRPRIGRDPLGERDVRYVFGLGPRIQLPIGPLRLDFTWGLRPAPGGPSYGRPNVQFAIGPSI